MPVKKLYRKKVTKRVPKKNYKKRTFRKAKDVPDLASLSVKRSMTYNNAQFNANTMYTLLNTQLIDYPRAVQVAGAYQHYRIKKITLTFKPSSDTFIVGGQATKPRLYYMIDKSGSIPTNIALEGLKAMGAKPVDLDEKNRVISWRPSVLESAMYAGGGAGASSSSKYRISPWLSTSAVVTSPGAFQPSGIDHLGLYWWLDMSIAGGYQYSIDCEVQFQFKKPLTNILASVEALPAQVATINDSSDGVVGGSDGV